MHGEINEQKHEVELFYSAAGIYNVRLNRVKNGPDTFAGPEEERCHSQFKPDTR